MGGLASAGASLLRGGRRRRRAAAPPALQAEITAALGDLKADSVLDYLQGPLEVDGWASRGQAVAALSGRPAQSAAGPRGPQARRTPAVTPDYAARALPALTGAELVGLADWGRVAATRGACPW